jgi:nicotinate dehydrogenase subunit B
VGESSSNGPTATVGAVQLTVNGAPVSVEVRESTPLMYVLRNELGMKGVRAGCTIGECGACTVIVNGVPRRSCLTPVGEVLGSSVITPEGLGTPDAPHPVQCAFLDEQAAQCGYCVNGMIMTVSAEVEAGRCADRASAQQALEEHICRCGTHERILRAAVRAGGGEVGDTAATFVDPADGLAPTEAVLPGIVTKESAVSRWLGITPEGRVEIRSPKVEIGQGILEAIRRMVASQLQFPADALVLRRTDTSWAVDLSHTAGSNSVDEGGVAMAYAAVALRRLLLERAAARLGEDVADLRLDADGVHGGSGSVTLTELAEQGIDGEILASDQPDWTAAALRAQQPRDDLRHKLTGAAAYIQDVELPGMVHVRALLPPTYDHEPIELPDLEAFARTYGLRTVLRDGRLLLVVAETEADAIRGVTALRREVGWKAPEAEDHPNVTELLRSLPSEPYTARTDEGVDAALAASRTFTASFDKPYEAHAPMSPSASLAHATDEGLRVWSQTQSPFPLRNEIATLTGLEPEKVIVEHVDGPGCYGMSGADDASAIAAIAALALPGVPVRYQHSIDDEFGWDPHGSGMASDLTAGLDAEGRIAAFRSRTWTDDHLSRPDGRGDRLLPAWLREDAKERPWNGPHEGGARDTVPYYDLAAVDAVSNYIRGPLRTGALRSLGSYFNVFALESFMDELAEAAGKDPVAFRLEHLSDPRARRVIEVAAERSGWTPRVGPSGRGLGIAFARYKAIKTYAAQAVEVDFDPERGTFEVKRIWVVADAGTVVDPEGLRHQLEGATLQSLSRAIHEELHLAKGTIRERDLSSYPVIRFPEVPPIDVAIIDRTGFPPLGAGESGTPALAAALANAIDDAVGIRIRQLPITPARIESRLLSMDETEMGRVRLG